MVRVSGGQLQALMHREQRVRVELGGFEREARVLAELQHPQIPTLVEAFREGSGRNSRLYLVESFIPGESLDARLKRGPISEEEARRIALQVLELLQVLHQRSP